MTVEKIEALELLRSVADEERWLQGHWHKEINGKHYVCLAAALGAPGTINGVEHWRKEQP